MPTSTRHTPALRNMNRAHCGNLATLAALHKGSSTGGSLAKLRELAGCGGETSAATQGGGDGGVSAASRSRDKRTRSFEDLMNFMALYSSLPAPLRRQAGHGFSQLLLACTFSGEDCLDEASYFRHSLHNNYGNCFTFDTSRKTVIPGKDYGLSMDVHLGRADYMGRDLSPYAGARVVVHDPEHAPLPEENGLTVPPGAASIISLLQVKITRLRHPYLTNCSTSWNDTWYAEMVNGTIPYSSERCHRVCLQLAFEEKCNCSHPSFTDLQSEASPCNLTASSYSNFCAADVLEEFEQELRVCSCNMDCSETAYETRISTSIWPNDAELQRMAREDLPADSNTTQDGRQEDEMAAELKRNLLRINIYYENLRVKSINQNPMYKAQAVVGLLGGALSLYLGVTLMMLLELVEVFCRLLFSAVKHCGHAVLSAARGPAVAHKRQHVPTTGHGATHVKVTGISELDLARLSRTVPPAQHYADDTKI